MYKYSFKISPLEALTLKEINTFYRVLKKAKKNPKMLSEKHCFNCIHKEPCGMFKKAQYCKEDYKNLVGLMFSVECPHFQKMKKRRLAETVSKCDVGAFSKVYEAFKKEAVQRGDSIGLKRCSYNFVIRTALDNKKAFLECRKVDKQIVKILKKPLLLSKIAKNVWQKQIMRGWENALQLNTSGAGFLHVAPYGYSKYAVDFISEGAEFPYRVDLQGHILDDEGKTLLSFTCKKIEAFQTDELTLIDKWLKEEVPKHYIKEYFKEITS